MELIYYSKELDPQTDSIFGFNGVNIRVTSDETEDIDLVIFASLQINIGLGSPRTEEEYRVNLRAHPNYEFSKRNPHIPVMFYHRHEFLLDEVHELFLNITSEELNISKEKIILLDSCINPRKGVINPPKITQFRQYKVKSYESNDEKTKKFSFLVNKNGKLRLQIFDKVISQYEGDVDKMREENVVSFRNYIFEENGPSTSIHNIEKYINESVYYKFQNNFDFYKGLGFPWIIDDFNIGHEYQKMYDFLHKLYSSSYFSLIIETGYQYLTVDYDDNHGGNKAFSEKALVAMSCGNLPFVIHFSDYYKQLESSGFDFSYLKTLFDIDYRENDIRGNFDSIEKFVSYFKNNTLDTIKKDYDNLIDIVENNRNVIKKLENREIDSSVIDFFEQIKSEKHK